MYIKWLIILLMAVSKALSSPAKCDQTPSIATLDTPSENKGLFVLDIQNSGSKTGEGKFLYTPNQTYVLTITSTSSERNFIWFMITAEDPDIDNNFNDFAKKYVDVGSMKTLDTGRSSESCFATVESADYSEKNKVSIHWVSPSPDAKNEAVRIRATVAENDESWYDGEELTIMLYKDHKKAVDNPPVEPRATCNLNSEARYEVIFEGKWSRMAHPRHYPSKPDENGYTHMVGASHAHGYPIWAESLMATEGLREMVLTGETTMLEDEIISNMALKTGTRTLIRGKRRHHPYMSEPSHALFRVDKYHHQFSIVVGMKPSPDWFLGTSKFELCTDNGWYEKASIPLYPWDAGIMDGDAYESKRTATAPQYTINRVEIGSFKSTSPFYKMNLDSLKPFAILTVRRLDVYPVNEDDDEEEENADNQEQEQEDN